MAHTSDRPIAEGTSVPLAVAIILMIPLRSDLGLRLLSWRNLIAGGIANVVGPYLLDVYFGQPLYPKELIICAFVILALGAAKRSIHWRAIRSGTSTVHGLETGRSVFSHFVPIGLANTVLDPLAAGGAGWVVMEQLNAPIGAWMIVCAICMALLECTVRFHERRRIIHTHDSVREAERHARRADLQVGRSRPGPAQSQTAGTSTGAADDLEWHFARRRD